MRNDKFILSDDFVFEVVETGIEYRAIRCPNGGWHCERYSKIGDDPFEYDYGGLFEEDFIRYVSIGSWRIIRYITPYEVSFPVDLTDLL